jgi:mycothiol synthase
MGTTPPCRGLGIGRILLWRCLNDLRDAGHETAVIPWVGPIGFYSRHCDCVLERVFWRYRIALTT